jgi:solute carrier family 25 citrate transporter 1
MASKKSRNPVVAMSAGAIAGGIETCVVWPMEFVKTQLQLQNKVAAPKYTGVFSCFKYTIQTTGFLSLYRGLAPVLIGSIPKAGIRFGGFAFIQDKFRNAEGNTTPARTLLAGMLAGAVESTLVVVPVETLKTRLVEGNQSFVRGAMDIIKKEGPGGVYRGWAATTVKQASNQGLRFMAFGQYKKFMLAGE